MPFLPPNQQHQSTEGIEALKAFKALKALAPAPQESKNKIQKTSHKIKVYSTDVRLYQLKRTIQ